MNPEYFSAEMRRLHQGGKEFSLAYPEQASLLNLQELRDKDPYVERLLEGVAFLTAQIREKIDDDIPEISATLLDQLCPHLLAPMPAASIVEFNLREGSSQKQTLPRGTLLTSDKVGPEATICQFASSSPVELHPITISDLSIDETLAKGSTFKLRLQTLAGTTFNSLNLNELKFYLHADPALAFDLYLALTQNLQSVQIQCADQAQILGGQNCLTAAHFAVEDSLLPLAGRSFTGYRLLHDYFTLREKYLFVTLKGLNKINWPGECQSLEIILHTRFSLPREHQLNKDLFRLHCTPVINLFPQDAEPINFDHQRLEYPLRADANAAKSCLVYDVETVTGIHSQNQTRHEYEPLYALRNPQVKHQAYYQVKRYHSAERLQQLNLVLQNPSDDLASQRISAAINVYNGDYPRQFLQEGSLKVGSPLASSVQATNLIRPTAMLMPPQREHYQWQLITHLNLNLQTILTREALQALLSLYDWNPQRSDNKQRIAGISNIRYENIERIQRGALRSGIEISLTLQEENFASIGDRYLFANLLHQFFQTYADFNLFICTQVMGKNGNLEWVFTA